MVTTPQKPYDHEYPFKGLNEKLHGIRYGELTTFTAGSGSGKTSFCRHIATHLLQSGVSVGILELEASNRRTALGLMSTATGKNLHIGEHDKEELDTPFQTVLPIGIFLFLMGLEVMIQISSITELNILPPGLNVRSLF